MAAMTRMSQCGRAVSAFGGLRKRETDTRHLPKDAVFASRGTASAVRLRHWQAVTHGRDDLQQLDRRLAVAVDRSPAGRRSARARQAEPLHHRRPGDHAQERGRLDRAQDVVLDQDAAQRRLPGDDLVAAPRRCNSAGGCGRCRTARPGRSSAAPAGSCGQYESPSSRLVEDCGRRRRSPWWASTVTVMWCSWTSRSW